MSRKSVSAESTPFADALRDMTRRCESLVQILSTLREMDLMDEPEVTISTLCCRIVEAIASNLAAQNCSLFLLDPATEVLELRAACSPFEDKGKSFDSGKWPVSRFKLGEGIAGAVGATCKSIRVEDTSRDSRFLNVPGGTVTVGSMLSFPLVVDKALVGVMNLSHSQSGYFSAEREHALSFLADRAARMLANHRLHEQIRDSEEHYRLATENAADAIAVFDDGGNLLSANRALKKISGLPPSQFVREEFDWKRFVHAEDTSLVQAHHESIQREKEPSTIEYRCVDNSGRVHYLEQQTAPLIGPSGEVKGVVCVARDVTERKHIEEQLLQSQKMECLGRLTGGVAHDFNNLLTIISGYAEMLRIQMAEVPHAVERIHSIEKAADRATQLVKQLLAFSRKEVLQPKVLDLNQTLTETAKMLERVLGEDVGLKLNLAQEPVPVLADPVHLVQVIMNLAVNARDAMPKGGTLAISTGAADVDEAFLRAHPQCKRGKYAVLTVNDTGCGMTEDVISHIWEPFYTTKESGKGTGLGLSTVHGIVIQSCGFIELESVIGAGSTFKLYFPHASGATAGPAPELKPAPAQGSGAVLVVEDEGALRALIVQILTTHGFEVFEASCPEQALAMESERVKSIRLLLTDVVMPEMSGTDLATIISEKNPAIKVLFMSGYSGNSVSEQGILSPTVKVLQKPFSSQDLIDRIHEALGQA